MSDFYQTGIITTLHHLGTGGVAQLEEKLVEDSEFNPIALIIPSLASEMDGPALPGIVKELAKVPYLRQIVVALDQASPTTSRGPVPSRPAAETRSSDRRPRHPVALPEAQSRTSRRPPGKGRGVWTAFGFVLADQTCRTIALHDADILTYSRGILARLCYPVVHPALSYEYAKGFYARVTDRMHGRVTRLFFTPLVRTLRSSAIIHIRLHSFTIPRGEFALDVELARVIFSGDWGSRSARRGHHNIAVRRIARWMRRGDHKHQTLDIGDVSGG
jgi:glucosyl-3-phosphoglycerate synthase